MGIRFSPAVSSRGGAKWVLSAIFRERRSSCLMGRCQQSRGLGHHAEVEGGPQIKVASGQDSTTASQGDDQPLRQTKGIACRFSWTAMICAA